MAGSATRLLRFESALPQSGLEQVPLPLGASVASSARDENYLFQRVVMKTECIHSRVQKTRRRVCTAHGKCSINVSYKGVTQLWELWRRGQMRTVHCWLPFNGKPQDVEPPACDADALWWLATLQTPGLAFHFLLSFLIWVPLTTETSAGPFLPPPTHTPHGLEATGNTTPQGAGMVL